MARFSERMGITEPRSVIQKDSIDEPLMNKLWDLVRDGYLVSDGYSLPNMSRHENYDEIYRGFFERAGDTVPRDSTQANQFVRTWFLREAEWWEVYDFLEFTVDRCALAPGVGKPTVVKILNEFLDKYMSAFRMVDGEFVPIVDDVQIAAIEEAVAHPLIGVKTHLSKALGFLADRQDPDVENSIKESISAVESICSAIVGKKATLGQALKKLEGAGLDLHDALEKGWIALYGYTSDEHGVRHAMQDESRLKTADALYFLVSCSAFVTLLTQKAQDAGVELVAVA